MYETCNFIQTHDDERNVHALENSLLSMRPDDGGCIFL